MQLAGTPEDKGEEYEHGAVIPREKTRDLSEEEAIYYLSSYAWPPSACISVFPIPNSIIETLREGAPASISGSQEFGARIWKLLRINTSLASVDDPHWLGMASRPGALVTTTVDGLSKRRVGLHIDSWDRQPLSERSNSRVRVCINVGLGPRYLLAVPHEVSFILSNLQAREQAEDIDGDPRRLVASYARVAANSNVFRIKVPSGFAYLAPTENMIHDGSSSDTDTDLTVTWLGRIILGC